MQRGAGIRPLGQRKFGPGIHAQTPRLYVNHHVLLLHRHRHSLRHIGSLHDTLALGHLHRIAPHLDAFRLTVRLPGADIELPAMPRATDDLALARILVLPRLVGLDEPGQDALAHRAALMRAAVEQAEELAAEIEHRDRTAAHGHQLPAARWNLGNRRDHVLVHAISSRLLASISVGRYIPLPVAATAL